jgi:hypothetical protein
MKAWKSIRADRRLVHDESRSWEVGVKLTHDKPLVLCESGFHASIKPRDALRFASTERTWIARVECGGEILTGNDKIVCAEMTPLWIADPTAILQRLALRWADKAVRVTAVEALRKIGLNAEADRLAACAEIVDEKTAGAASYAAWAASYAAGAASDAAWAASYAAGAASDAAVAASDAAVAASYAAWAASYAAGAASDAAWAASDAAVAASDAEINADLEAAFEALAPDGSGR